MGPDYNEAVGTTEKLVSAHSALSYRAMPLLQPPMNANVCFRNHFSAVQSSTREGRSLVGEGWCTTCLLEAGMGSALHLSPFPLARKMENKGLRNVTQER